MCRECLLVLNLSSRRQVSRGEISYRFLGGLCEVFVFLLLTFWGHSILVDITSKCQLHPGEIVFCGQFWNS